MGVASIVGYLAALLTLGTYSMKTMVRLRICGIAANVLFAAFGFLSSNYPTMFLHLVIVPINSVRLYQMVQLTRRVTEASDGDLNMDWLKPFMSSRRVAMGDVLFRKGDPANDLFYIVSGRFRVGEMGTEMGPGALVGELGFLAPDHARTRTLECVDKAVVLRISYDQMKQLYFQNPDFGFYLLRLASQRLFRDIASRESEAAVHPSAHGGPAGV
jgi:hypothetical protein